MVTLPNIWTILESTPDKLKTYKRIIVTQIVASSEINATFLGIPNNFFIYTSFLHLQPLFSSFYNSNMMTK